MERRLAFAGLLASAAVAITCLPRAAHACGSCVHEPPPPMGDNVSAVTDHRVVMSLSASRTIIWDQFASAGDGGRIAWIFPVADASQVEVAFADERFVDALDQATAPYFDHAICTGGYITPGGTDAGSGPLDAGVPPHGTPFVSSFGSTQSATLPPPMTVQRIAGTDPQAIVQWISDQHYEDPALSLPSPPPQDAGAIGGPVMMDPIREYAARHFDFVAVQFEPSPGVRQMPPVRITVQGYDPTLPLRGIAVGAAEEVGLTLIVLADGRIDPTVDYPQVDLQAIRLEGADAHSAYTSAIDRIRASTPDIWINEAAFPIVATELAPVNGTEDFALAFGDQPSRIGTRIRAILPAYMPLPDLRLEASLRPLESRQYYFRYPTDEECPVYDGGSGGATRGDAGVVRASDAGDWGRPRARCSCSTPSTNSRAGYALVLFAGLAACATGRRRHRTQS